MAQTPERLFHIAPSSSSPSQQGFFGYIWLSAFCFRFSSSIFLFQRRPRYTQPHHAGGGSFSKQQKHALWVLGVVLHPQHPMVTRLQAKGSREVVSETAPGSPEGLSSVPGKSRLLSSLTKPVAAANTQSRRPSRGFFGCKQCCSMVPRDQRGQHRRNPKNVR